LTRQLRASRDFLPELDLVAVEDGRVIGNILFTRSRVVGSMNENFETVTFGPVSVLPECQKRGVGRALIEGGLRSRARRATAR
jgi:predicted N-acetyltransferase YhbS